MHLSVSSLQETDATVTNNAWTGYSSYGVFAYGGNVVVDNASYDMASGHIAACRDGTMTASNLSVNTTTSSSYRSYEIYVDGVLSDSYPETNAFPAAYMENCNGTLENADFTDTVAMAIRTMGGTWTMTDVSATRANSGGYYSNAAVELTVAIAP